MGFDHNPHLPGAGRARLSAPGLLQELSISLGSSPGGQGRRCQVGFMRCRAVPGSCCTSAAIQLWGAPSAQPTPQILALNTQSWGLSGA